MYDKIRKTTIQDAAKQTGVRNATVSRVLNNGEGISKNTYADFIDTLMT
ncbi:LacI family DNA-binding transcriptional regulator [Paenibacillus tuaregi]|nr:LacI family DNA-binding transcriptional regulator [Paenibacillus tuaregi]